MTNIDNIDIFVHCVQAIIQILDARQYHAHSSNNVNISISISIGTTFSII